MSSARRLPAGCQQQADCVGAPAGWPCAGAQQAGAPAFGPVARAARDTPKVGASPSVRYASHAMPCGSTLQYLSERA
ncbi:hypothetical protein DM50_3704 [Burkholderia mallei]|nr:hypothetical protein DM50_3704 [Burkholderia mallei]